MNYFITPILVVLLPFSFAQGGNFYYEIDTAKCEKGSKITCIKDAVAKKFPKEAVPKLQDEKAELGYVFIHGLWGNRNQFRKWADDVASAGHNAFLLGLPGHDEDRKNSEATRHDWKKEVRAAVLLAKQTSKNVVVVGQSTGGILAVQQAIENPQSVDGLILIEPAFLVKTTPLLGACVGQFFVKETKNLEPLASKLGHPTQDGQYLNFGCEVEGIRRDLVKKYVQTEGHVCPTCNGESKTENVFQDLGNLFKLVKVPSAIVKNTEDIVVSNQAIDIYKKTLSDSAELTVISEKTRHGDNNSIDGSCMSANDFVQKTFQKRSGISCGSFNFYSKVSEEEHSRAIGHLRRITANPESSPLKHLEDAEKMSAADLQNSLYQLTKDMFGSIHTLKLYNCQQTNSKPDEVDRCMMAGAVGKKLERLNTEINNDFSAAVFQDYIDHHKGVKYKIKPSNGKKTYEVETIKTQSDFDVAAEEYIGRNKKRIIQQRQEMAKKLESLLAEDEVKRLLNPTQDAKTK